MNTTIVLISFAAAWTSASLLVAEWLSGHRRRIRQRVSKTAKAISRGTSEASSLFRNWDMPEDRAGWLVACETFVDQSALPLTLARLGAICACLAAASASIAVAVGCHWSVPALAALGGAAAPIGFVKYARDRRIERLTRQLPEAFDIMRRAVHSGQTVACAFQLAAAEMRGPLAREFAQCCEQQNLGLAYDLTLRDLARRIPIAELQIFAIAMMVQRQFGGDPAEILSNMAELIRKRMRLRNRVRALTGEGRMQAIVLTVLPVAAFAWLSITRPEYIQTLVDRPKLLAGVAMFQVVGAVWIRRIVRIDY